MSVERCSSNGVVQNMVLPGSAQTTTQLLPILKLSSLHLKSPIQPPTIQPIMETFTFPYFPSYATPIHTALFKNVTNSSGIRKRLIEASTMTGAEGDVARDKVDFGFIDASLVCSVLPRTSDIHSSRTEKLTVDCFETASDRRTV